jgi:hypothetical protein
VVFLILCFTLCPFETKRGSSSDLDQDCIYNQSSIFVLEWPKGEFVSL